MHARAGTRARKNHRGGRYPAGRSSFPVNVGVCVAGGSEPRFSLEARWRFGDRQPGNDDGGNKLAVGTLPGIEWAIVDTVNIQPEFPVVTTR